MNKREEIIIDIKNKLRRKDIAEKHNVSTTYVSHIKKSITPDAKELLKFMNNFFKLYFEYLIENPKIKIFVELNEENFNKIEELVS